MTSAVDVPVREGDVLAGKYRVERVLGSGGMGVVVSAVHVELNERVGLKFLLGAAAQRPEYVARFLREAQAAVRIKSEHVARVSDVGRLENGAPYMVMEFLAGRDLSEVLRAKGRLSIETVVDYVLQAIEAVAEAHSLGIVHRDLKPANLFLTKRADGSPLVKVLDFGISKALTPAPGSAPDPALTKTTGMLGTPYYVPPEQIRSARKVDPRADVWALGVILHELIAGTPPFHAETVHGLLAAILEESPVRLREVLPGAPASLEATILRCLEKDPGLRFQNVAELAQAIAPFSEGQARVSVDRVSRLLMGAASTMAPSSDAPTPRPGGVAPTVDNTIVRTVQAEPPRPAQTLNITMRTLQEAGQIGGRTTAGWGQRTDARGEHVGAPRSKAMLVSIVGAALVLAAGAWVAVSVLARGEKPDAVAAQPATTELAPSPSASASASARVVQAVPEIDLDTLPAASANPTARNFSGNAARGTPPKVAPSAVPLAPPTTPAASPTKRRNEMADDPN